MEEEHKKKYTLKEILIEIFSLFVIITLLTLTIPLGGLTPKKNWTLSLYNNQITIFRILYISNEACLDSGKKYLNEGSADRFTCGYNCEKSISLQQVIKCNRIINSNEIYDF